MSVVDVSTPGNVDVESFALALIREDSAGALEALTTVENDRGLLDVPKKRREGQEPPEDTARRALRKKGRWTPLSRCGTLSKKIRTL